MYHRVLNKEEISASYSQTGIIVSKKTFAIQMEYLKKHFNVISLIDTIQNLKFKTHFRSRSCLVTFDDGWKDNYKNAFPILKKNHIPAVIFLPTDFIGTNKLFWQERLTKLLLVLYENYSNNSDFKIKNFGVLNSEDIAAILSTSTKEINEKISKFVSLQKSQKKIEVDNLIQRLESFLKVSSNTFEHTFFLNWDEIRIMAKNGIDFGSHGKSHKILTNDEVDIQQELKDSKNVIEDELKTKVNSFSYPNGNYSEEVVNLVKKNGYEIAFGTESGFVSPNDDPYTLKRINIHEDMTGNIPMFLARIVGLW